MKLIFLHSVKKKKAKKRENSGFFSVGKAEKEEKSTGSIFPLSPAFRRIFHHWDNPDPNCSWHRSGSKLGTGRSLSILMDNKSGNHRNSFRLKILWIIPKILTGFPPGRRSNWNTDPQAENNFSIGGRRKLKWIK